MILYDYSLFFSPMLFSSSSQTALLAPTLYAHLQSPTCQTARFDAKAKAYRFVYGGRSILCGGLLNTLRKRHYPRYKHSKRRKSTKAKGSSKSIGSRVDQELANEISGDQRAKKILHPYTQAILKYLRNDNNHILVAAQVPAKIRNELKMTQADLLSVNSTSGKTFLYEVKTGKQKHYLIF